VANARCCSASPAQVPGNSGGGDPWWEFSRPPPTPSLVQVARIREKDYCGRTALFNAAESRNLEVMQYLLVSLEGGTSSTEMDKHRIAALLEAALSPCQPTIVQWLLEYGGAQITDLLSTVSYMEGSVWTELCQDDLPDLLRGAYTKNDDGEYVNAHDDEELAARVSMLRVLLLHNGPPEFARRRAAAGTAPSIPSAATGPFRCPLPAVASTPGPSARLRGAHHYRRALGHEARGNPVTRQATQA
jgi:hypothetical protein